MLTWRPPWHSSVSRFPRRSSSSASHPIVRDARANVRIDWVRVGCVVFILSAAVAANLLVNLHWPQRADSFPFLGAAVWVAILLTRRCVRPSWNLLPQRGTRRAVSGCARGVRFADAGRGAAGGFVADGAWPRIRLRGVRQHPAHQARAGAGRLRLGLSRLCRRLRRVDDLVRLLRGRCHFEPVSAGALGRRMAAQQLVYPGRLPGGIFRAAGDARLAPARAACIDRSADVQSLCRAAISRLRGLRHRALLRHALMADADRRGRLAGVAAHARSARPRVPGSCAVPAVLSCSYCRPAISPITPIGASC